MDNESPAILSDSLSTATEGAVADLNAANAPEPQPAAEPAQATNESPTPQVDGPPPPETPPEFSYEAEYQGRKVKLDKSQLDEVVRFALNAYTQTWREMQEQQNAPPAPQAEPPAPQGQAPTTPQDIQRLIKQGIEEAVKPHIERIQKWEKDLSIKQIYQEVDEAALKNDVVKSLISDPRFAPRVKAWIMQERAANPDLSWESAAKQVAEMFEWQSKNSVNTYVKDKINQAGKRVEGSGGAAPAPGGKKLGPEHVFDRKTMDAAIMQDLMAPEGP